MKLGNKLANSDIETRNKALEDAERYLVENPGLSELEMLKVWKGIHYNFWMSDTRPAQHQCAQHVSSIIFKLPLNCTGLFLKTFWSTIAREWYNIDRLRLDKYYMLLREMHKNTFVWLREQKWAQLDELIDVLVSGPLSPTLNTLPASLRYHSAKVLFEELINSLPKGEVVTVDVGMKLLKPLITLLQRSTDSLMIEKIWENVINSGICYLLEQEYLKRIFKMEDLVKLLFPLPRSSDTIKKNKKLLNNLVKNWALQNGLPFVDHVQVTGMDVVTVDVEVDLDSALSILENTKVLENSEKSDEMAHIVPAAKNKKGPANNQPARSKFPADSETSEHEKMPPSTSEGKSRQKQAKRKLNDRAEIQSGLSRPSPAKMARTESPKNPKVSESVKFLDIKESGSPIAEDFQDKSSRANSSTAGLSPTQKGPKQGFPVQSTPSIGQDTKDGSKLQNQLINGNRSPAAQKQPNSSKENATPELQASDIAGSKSVSWGSNEIKPFFKRSTMCSLDEAKTVPVTDKPAPKVLKKTDYVPILLDHTAGAKSSKRNRNKNKKK